MFASPLPAQETHDTRIPAVVFGPTVYSSPATMTNSFAIPPLAYGPFTVHADNFGVTDGNIELNGIRIFGPEAFASQTLHKVVTLEATNTLRVELQGVAGASLSIVIEGYGYRFAADYQDLPLAQRANPNVGKIDWRSRGAVTPPIENEGQCGSDWAFTATGAAAGWRVAQAGKSLLLLSAQQLIDCSRAFGTFGCNGGSPAAAMQYIAQNGLCISTDYPYTARDGACKKFCSPIDLFSQVIRIPVGDEQTLAANVAQQPVSVVLNGNWFSGYVGGLANPDCEGPAKPVFAAALIIGFGQTDSADPATAFWLVKNSLGPSWGEHGLFRLVRGKNKCAIADFATFPR